MSLVTLVISIMVLGVLPISEVNAQGNNIQEVEAFERVPGSSEVFEFLISAGLVSNDYRYQWVDLGNLRINITTSDASKVYEKKWGVIAKKGNLTVALVDHVYNLTLYLNIHFEGLKDTPFGVSIKVPPIPAKPQKWGLSALDARVTFSSTQMTFYVSKNGEYVCDGFPPEMYHVNGYGYSYYFDGFEISWISEYSSYSKAFNSLNITSLETLKEMVPWKVIFIALGPKRSPFKAIGVAHYLVTRVNLDGYIVVKPNPYSKEYRSRYNKVYPYEIAMPYRFRITIAKYTPASTVPNGVPSADVYFLEVESDYTYHWYIYTPDPRWREVLKAYSKELHYGYILDKPKLPIRLSYAPIHRLIEYAEELQKKTTELIDSYSKLETSHKILKSRYEKLEADYKNLETSYKTLEKVYSRLQSEYSSLKLSYQKLADRVSSLEALNELGRKLTLALSACIVILAVAFVISVRKRKKSK